MLSLMGLLLLLLLKDAEDSRLNIFQLPEHFLLSVVFQQNIYVGFALSLLMIRIRRNKSKKFAGQQCQFADLKRQRGERKYWLIQTYSWSDAWKLLKFSLWQAALNVVAMPCKANSERGPAIWCWAMAVFACCKHNLAESPLADCMIVSNWPVPGILCAFGKCWKN